MAMRTGKARIMASKKLPQLAVTMGTSSEMKRGEKEDEETGNPILFMVDRKSGKINAHGMPQKGVHPYAVKRVVQDFKLLGYTRINLKSDQDLYSLKTPTTQALLGQ